MAQNSSSGGKTPSDTGMNTSEIQKHDTSPTPRMLTRSEIESLRQEMKESLEIIRNLAEREDD